MVWWMGYKSLVKVYLTSYFTHLLSMGGKRMGRNRYDETQSKGKQAMGKILSVVSILIIVAILVSATITFTLSGIEMGFFDRLPYMLVGASQLTLLLLGGNVVLSYLYFSDDGKLLLSLPLTGTQTFAAKFTVSYLSQLLISAFFIPVFIAFGVTASLNGVTVAPSFYVLAVLSSVLLPAFPTFLVGVFSAPLMLLIKIFKNKERVKTLVTIVSSSLGMILYFAIVFSTSFSGGSEDTLVSAQTAGLVVKFSEFFIFNYHFCEAMLGSNVLGYLLLYVAECFGASLLAILLCSILFKKIMMILQESSVVGKKVKIKGDPYAVKSFKKAMFLKDLKLVVKTPTLLFSSVIGIVLVPIFTVVFNSMFGDMGEDTSVYSSELMHLGLCYYFVMIMTAASNSVTAVSISVEKSNFYILKTMPITGKQLVRSKLNVALIFNGLICLSFLVAYLCMTKVPLQPLFGVLLCAAFFIHSAGLSLWEILRDLQKPNFRFTNVNELTRNNRTLMKPIFVTMGVSIAAMAAGIALGSVLPADLIYLGYIIFFVIVYGLALAMFFWPISTMNKKADALYEALEV
ncbi:MAG: hypothetical protein J5781_05500 [Clostridia bacterium]|nr:hypothetical protein [Clostridia bacterium]